MSLCGGASVEENQNEIPKQEKMSELEVGMGDLVVERPEKVVKHPLENAWTLWFFKNDKSRTWEENQRPIITVTTVEDFWSLYNHIEVASRLPPGSDYSLFKVDFLGVQWVVAQEYFWWLLSVRYRRSMPQWTRPVHLSVVSILHFVMDLEPGQQLPTLAAV